VNFRVLGPLGASDEHTTLALGPRKQRALLARLLLDAGRTVSVERLVDDLWGEDVPESAVKMVQIYVSGLRKAVSARRLLTRGPGYCLELADADVLDLHEFERLAGSGRAALAQGDPEAAAGRLRAALALWRGPALAEFSAEPFARAEGDRLEALQLETLEDRLEADLQLGHSSGVTAELEALTARHPLRERLRGQLMLALYRSGRQGEALAAYHSFRATLDAELGIGPSARLRALEHAILTQDRALDVRPPARALAAPAHEAPPGRARELDALQDALAAARSGARRLVAVSGEAGMGKTTVVEAFLGKASGAIFMLLE
jgi:DNA-binding SARP family transcriptional activator